MPGACRIWQVATGEIRSADLEPDDGTIEDALLRGRFIAQPARPGDARDVGGLTAVQRALLLNDGTVTSLLEALAREPIMVDVLDQRDTSSDADGARSLDLPADSAIVSRRVLLRGLSGRVHAVAESLLVPARLPPAFILALAGNSRGLGAVLDELRLETRRDLLWFGAADTPEWSREAGVREPALLTRSYRVVVGGVPAILITEGFLRQAGAAPLRSGAGPSKAGSAGSAGREEVL